jgi:Coenzyme PQQ synthesis protein D (PqqD)
VNREAPIKRNPKVVHRPLAEGGVLLHLDSGQYHGVNRVGLLVWDLLEGEPTFALLLADLRRQLADPPDRLEGDIDAFLDGLLSRDLIAECT